MEPDKDKPKEPTTSSKTTKSSVRSYVVTIVIVLAVVGLGALFANWRSSDNGVPKVSAISPAPAQVSITSAGFIPATVTIVQNQAVIWTNNDSAPHQVDSDPYPKNNDLPGFDDTQAIGQNDSYSFTFDQRGTFTYHDNLNPYKLLGTVIVK
ncbi:MAG TPA: cupredoxin domain-containing protein [Candidatus Saccharimonadales bacterium]|nr:cupredoxin domain-containing protein [Candidatus Saccharimonadales bacterium]